MLKLYIFFVSSTDENVKNAKKKKKKKKKKKNFSVLTFFVGTADEKHLKF